jgi:deazaflavin-dependent oxidoreductase (nitroreductase family)
VYIRDGDSYVITAAYAGADKHPSWFVNLQANPKVMIEVSNVTRSVVARQASAEEKKRLWAQLIAQAPFFEGYQQKTTRDIPMVILQQPNEEQPVG